MGAVDHGKAVGEEHAGKLQIEQPSQGANHLFAISTILRRQKTETV